MRYLKHDMTVTFFSNFLNHHQTPFCDEMYKLLTGNFNFVATERVPDERLNLGYKDYSHSFPYNINSYESKILKDKALTLANESDVIIIGSAPDVFIKERLRNNKVTFRYYERFFKKGTIRLLDPRVLINNLLTHTLFRSKNLHLLCASAFTSFDATLLHAYPNKRWKWGYFPEVHEYDIEKLMSSKPVEKLNILWVGRFLNWKHPKHAIKIARRLKDKNYLFFLNLIGTGDELEETKKKVKKYGLEEFVSFLGPMNHEEVRSYMEKANIFLFTSDKQEGWGVVLNEAMNSGCAIIASDAIGSVPFLINDQINGLVYKSGNVNELFNKVESLMINFNLRNSLGRNAYDTIVTRWSPKIAADRFIRLSKSILEGKEIQFEDGPCSIAQVIRG